MPKFLIEDVRLFRGTYPVANLLADYLEQHANSPFKLGNWLATLNDLNLQDIQTKLGFFLNNEGPDHAAEDLVATVDLLSTAEKIQDSALNTDETFNRLKTWHDANLFEKLHRAGMLKLTAPLSINPAEGVYIQTSSACPMSLPHTLRNGA